LWLQENAAAENPYIHREPSWKTSEAAVASLEQSIASAFQRNFAQQFLDLFSDHGCRSRRGLQSSAHLEVRRWTKDAFICSRHSVGSAVLAHLQFVGARKVTRLRSSAKATAPSW